MSKSSGRIIPNADRYRFLPCNALAGIGSLSLLVVAPLGAAKADSQQSAVVVRLDAKKPGLTASELTLRIGDIRVPAVAIKASPQSPRSIAIVIDAGPDQTNVLAREKELGIALINEFSDGSTTFVIATSGTLSNPQAALDPSAATRSIREIAAATGVKTNVPIYDPIASAARLISRSPGLRIVVFIGEGNDGGSNMHYPELCSLAESNQIAFFAALVADHSLRGAKSLLRYGWNLRELSGDTAGVFLENEKTPKATRRLTQSIRGLRLISFEMPSLQPGRYKISASERQGKRMHAQKAIVIP